MIKCRIGQKSRCLEKGCQFKALSGGSECVNEVLVSEKGKMYVWVGRKSGVHITSNRDYRPAKKRKDKMKYMGWTYDFGYPKRMNTGRVLYEAV